MTVSQTIPVLAFNLDIAAKAIGVSKSGMWRLINDRAIAHVRVGKRRVVIRREDLEAYLEKNRIQSIDAEATAKSILRQSRRVASI